MTLSHTVKVVHRKRFVVMGLERKGSPLLIEKLFCLILPIGFGFDSHKLTSGGGEEHNAYRFNLTTVHFPLSCGSHRRVPTYEWFHFLI